MHSSSYSEYNPLFHRSQELRSRGVEPYAKEFCRTHSLCDINEQYEGIGADIPTQEGLFKICGRVMSVVERGRYLLISIADQNSTFQLILSPDEVGTHAFDLFNHFVYHGDYLGFTIDYLYREQGYLTGVVKSWCFLTLAHLPIPKNMSIERQRAELPMHLASSFATREKIVCRARILRFIRQFMDKHDVMEINPVCSANPAAFNPLLHYLVGGFEQVYEFVYFSDVQTVDSLNHPQTMWLRFCAALKSPQQLMLMLEHMLTQLTVYLHATSRIIWQPCERMNASETAPSVELLNEQHTIEIDMSLNWVSRTLYQIIDDVLKIDFAQLTTTEHAVQVLAQAGITLDAITPQTPLSHIAVQLFEQHIAATLVQPTFVVMPAYDMGLPERFELYINGILFARGQSEITDPQWHLEIGHEDQSLQKLLMIGLPPTSSIMLNIDRLVMLMTGASDIRDVIHIAAV